LTVGCVALIMTLGRWVANRALPSLQAHLAWSEDDLCFLLVTGLVGTMNTEAIDIHASFSAFLAGTARCGEIE
jgi:Kef-type K+ transport system membrane component KefB